MPARNPVYITGVRSSGIGLYVHTYIRISFCWFGFVSSRVASEAGRGEARRCCGSSPSALMSASEVSARSAGSGRFLLHVVSRGLY